MAIKTILIAGLDGSGKSTLFSKLVNSGRSDIGILRSPAINVELFNSNHKLYKAAIFINWLNSEAESLKVPQLKAVALFTSMLIFKDLLAELEKQNFSTVFCERHPLIDMSVYAKFYADKMDPAKIPTPTLAEIDYNFNAELVYFTNTLKLKKADMPKGACYHILLFMYQWFYMEKKFQSNQLNELFLIDLPDKIYYLKADPEILIERIKRRKTLELHETPDALDILIPEFDRVIERAEAPVEKVNANEVRNLDDIYEHLSKNYV